jgi:hypothetical protein
MNSYEYEHIVAEYYENLGYKTEVSQQSNDYGLDVLAIKGKIRIAIQVKMYGGSSRPINRQMIMELQGVKNFFDCTKAVLATNGRVLENASEVAEKLKIEIINIPAIRTKKTNTLQKGGVFESIWENYVMPLEGKTIIRDKNKSNKILKVDWSGVERLTSNGKKQKIKIEIFKKTVNHLIKNGSISRKYINDEYTGRASSGIVLILGNTSRFELTTNPTGLKMK